MFVRREPFNFWISVGTVPAHVAGSTLTSMVRIIESRSDAMRAEC
jgi:hypothetical protein